MTQARVVVVTGAAGELGRAIASALMISGMRVIALDRSESALRSASDEWDAIGLRDFALRIVDQSDSAQVRDAVSSIREDEGPISGLVANAGYAKFGAFLDAPTSTWDRHVAVNLSGTFYMCQAVAQCMARDRKGGWITVISSNLALSHADQVSSYCVTKAALLSMVQSAAAELGVHRIRVNAVCPGVVETGMTRGMLEQPGVTEGLLNLTPLGRLGSTRDVTSAISYLASDDAGWITGASLLVDGGQSIYGQPAWIRQDRSVPHDPVWVDGYQTSGVEQGELL